MCRVVEMDAKQLLNGGISAGAAQATHAALCGERDMHSAALHSEAHCHMLAASSAAA